jgi:TolB-like protein/DNA-binding winged helix-turn-helix (wHTH) protein
MHTSTEADAVFHFGDFQLDLKNQELRRDGRAVKLAPQPFRVLALLVRRAGELVRREELERDLWGGDTVVDFRQGLNSCILQLREALGDSARRRGYKFIASVRRELPASQRPAVSAVAGPSRSRSLRLLAVAAVAAVVLLTAAFVGGRHPVPQAEAAGNRVMVAVLPFADLGGTEPVEAFADGLTDEVIALLGRQYKGSDKDIQEVGRELGVAYVIEGSVRREGSHARITAQLVRVRDQAYIWCDSYDRELARPLEVQKEVGQLVAAFCVTLPRRTTWPGCDSAATSPVTLKAKSG